MILEIIKTHSGKLAYCKCDKCNKEFTRANSLLNQKSQYCSRECSGSGRAEINPNMCVVCGKPKDNTFYDKSATRPLCSKACYSKYADDYYKACVKWERKRPANNMGNDVKKVNYSFYKTGTLHLANYNLGVF